MSIIRFENWATGVDPYTAPECRGLQLIGNVYGHPSHYPGKLVRTSNIVSVDGLLGTTYSGSQYRLGEPDLEWLKYLEKEGLIFDPTNPIKMKSPEGKDS